MTHLPDALRHRMIARARGYCEYCYTEMEIRVDMAVDPIRPVSDDGTTTEDNLCLACFSGSSKHNHRTGIDPDNCRSFQSVYTKTVYTKMV